MSRQSYPGGFEAYVRRKYLGSYSNSKLTPHMRNTWGKEYLSSYVPSVNDIAVLNPPHISYPEQVPVPIFGQQQNPAIAAAQVQSQQNYPSPIPQQGPQNNPNSELEVKGQAEQRQIPVSKPETESLYSKFGLMDFSNPNSESYSHGIQSLYDLDANRLKALVNHQSSIYPDSERTRIYSNVLSQKLHDEPEEEVKERVEQADQAPPIPVFGPENRPERQMNPAVYAANIEQSNRRDLQNAQHQMSQQMMAQQGNNISLPMLAHEFEKLQQQREKHVPIYPKRNKMLEVMRHFDPNLYNPDYMPEEED